MADNPAQFLRTCQSQIELTAALGILYAAWADSIHKQFLVNAMDYLVKSNVGIIQDFQRLRSGQ